MLVKLSWVMRDGSISKVSCSDMVEPMASCSDWEGLPVCCVPAQILNVASQWGESNKATCVYVVFPRAPCAYVRGPRDSWEVREVSRPPLILSEVPRKLSSVGETDNTFCIEVSGFIACLMCKTCS